ncbi:hypothetical protein Nepgr_015574 [Nepenthes gracilis]|uniref:Uncharacterized protein n=1 Tax=Nepenthes gracilis TaxID=150966 RepID=A0AAD3SM06_NEPGR|nr:hypothetical protein Nepgr_015574 [Nepenthes gracilis]
MKVSRVMRSPKIQVSRAMKFLEWMKVFGEIRSLEKLEVTGVMRSPRGDESLRSDKPSEEDEIPGAAFGVAVSVGEDHAEDHADVDLGARVLIRVEGSKSF